MTLYGGCRFVFCSCSTSVSGRVAGSLIGSSPPRVGRRRASADPDRRGGAGLAGAGAVALAGLQPAERDDGDVVVLGPAVGVPADRLDQPLPGPLRPVPVGVGRVVDR